MSTELWFSAEYWSFKIGDELNDEYRLEVSGFSGDAGDSLQYEGDKNGDRFFGNYNHQEMDFTTIDEDNDESDASNCAAENGGGGWWYNSCFWACLTCDEYNTKWGSLPDPFLINSRMMIKPQ